MTTTTNVYSSDLARGRSSRRTRFMGVALWIVQVVLALTFLFAGVAKFVMSAEDLTKDIDLSVAFLRFIGACEVLGAFGLLLPGPLRLHRALTPLAAAGLVVIMIGAVVITVASMGVGPALFPLVVGILAAFVTYGRWPRGTR
jgi:hypothetical protein